MSPANKPLLQRYLDLTLQQQDVERELSIAEKKVKNAPPAPKIDTQYFHDVGASLYTPQMSHCHLKSAMESLFQEKADILKSLQKELGVDAGKASTPDAADVKITNPKILFSSFSEVFEAVASELSEMCEVVSNSNNPTNGSSTAPAIGGGLKLFVHDRLGHAESPLQFNSWEQRFQQRMAQAKDAVGKVKQGLVDIVNSVGINYKENALVKDVAKWTAFVALIDAAFVTVLSNALLKALNAYTRQLQGANVRELFAVNLKLNQTAMPVMVPTTQDLVSKLSTLFRTTLFSICPENAVAHVVSVPTNLTRDGAISPKKICVENPQLIALLARLDGIVSKDIAEDLNATTNGILKKWEKYWSPAMAVAKGPELLKAVTHIQSDFVVSHSIQKGAILLSAFPLLDAVISMLHLQIENAKDNEIKSLIEVWSKAIQAKTVKETSPLLASNANSTVVVLTKIETHKLDTVGTSSVPLDEMKSLSHKTFDPLAFAKQTIADVKKPSEVIPTVSRSSVDATATTTATTKEQPSSAAGAAPPLASRASEPNTSAVPTKAAAAVPPASVSTPRAPSIPSSSSAPRVPSVATVHRAPSATSTSTAAAPTITTTRNPSASPSLSSAVTSGVGVGSAAAANAPTTLGPILTPRTAARANYTTMTVEEVKGGSENDEKKTTMTTTTSTTLQPTKPPTSATTATTEPPKPSTPRDGTAAEFRRRVEESVNASAAAAQRKEELRLSTPRSPNRKSSASAATNSSSVDEVPPPAAPKDVLPAIASTDKSVTSSQPKSIIKQSSSTASLSEGSGSYHPPATAPTARRSSRVEFDPNTAVGGTGPSAAFKRQLAPPEDDDETILRKLMQKEKESMERIRLMKEKDEERRKAIAAAHRMSVLEEAAGGGGGGDRRKSKSSPSLNNNPASTSRPIVGLSAAGGGFFPESAGDSGNDRTNNKGSTLLPPISDSPTRAGGRNNSENNNNNNSSSSVAADAIRRSQEMDKRIQDAVARENERVRALRSEGGGVGHRSSLDTVAGSKNSPPAKHSVGSGADMTSYQRPPSGGGAHSTASYAFVNHTPSNSPDRGAGGGRPSLVGRNPIYEKDEAAGGGVAIAAGGGSHRPSLAASSSVYDSTTSPTKASIVTKPAAAPSSAANANASTHHPITSSNDPLRGGSLFASSSSSAGGGRPDSALRRKLALPSVNTSSNSTTTTAANAAVSGPLHPSPPTLAAAQSSAAPSEAVGLSSVHSRKPQTAPVGNNTPRGSTLLANTNGAANGGSSPLLSFDPKTSSLLEIYRSYCVQYNIKPNSGLLKILPKTVGETISKINLDLNYIGVKGFQPLLQILKVNRGLTFLNLKDNNLENNEVKALVSVLSTECGDMLQHLDLSNNPISLAGGSSLVELIGKQKSLTTVVVNGTLIQPKIVEKIEEALAAKR